MELEITRDGDQLDVRVEGEINTLTAPELHAAIAGDLATVDRIVFDFTDATYITSAGLRVLLICQQELEDRGGVTVRNASSVISELMEIAGFDTIITLE